MNWIIKPNLFNHTTLAYDRWVMLGHQLSGGVGWNQKLGLGLPDAPIFNNAGFPELDFNGSVGYTHFGTAVGERRRRYQQPLSVSGRRVMDDRQAHDQSWCRISLHDLPADGLGREHRRQLQIRGQRNCGL